MDRKKNNKPSPQPEAIIDADMLVTVGMQSAKPPAGSHQNGSRLTSINATQDSSYTVIRLTQLRDPTAVLGCILHQPVTITAEGKGKATKTTIDAEGLKPIIIDEHAPAAAIRKQVEILRDAGVISCINITGTAEIPVLKQQDWLQIGEANLGPEAPPKTPVSAPSPAQKASAPKGKGG